MHPLVEVTLKARRVGDISFSISAGLNFSEPLCSLRGEGKVPIPVCEDSGEGLSKVRCVQGGRSALGSRRLGLQIQREGLGRGFLEELCLGCAEAPCGKASGHCWKSPRT